MDLNRFIKMISYRRPEGTVTQRIFCEEFLEPIYGKPDDHGNYIHIVKTANGSLPRIMFTSHHDTVHSSEGLQQLSISHNMIRLMDTPANKKECLGADCTTGIFIMDEMIKANIPGIYVVHAGEEIGCVGSGALVADPPFWLEEGNVQYCISFDRYGSKSIITHQMMRRTASDEFAASFSEALDMPQLSADDGGAFTDSNEYVDIVPECTNISVGYMHQHSSKEIQDLEYLDFLIKKLKAADWSKLVAVRDPKEVDYGSWGLDYGYGGARGMYAGGYGSYSNYRGPKSDNGRSDKKLDFHNYEELLKLIQDDPYTIAHLLDEWDISAEDLHYQMYKEPYFT